MQPDRPVITPGQALSRMAQAAHALVRVSVATWRRQAVAAMRAMGQGARAAGCHLAQIARLARLAQIARIARLARALATGLIRLARQGLQGPGAMAADIASPRILPAWSLEPLAARPQPGARIARRLAAPWPGLGRVAQRLAGAAARLRLAWLGGLAAASALCLLVGAPQAWAAMLSSTSLQALQATPQLLRAAFSANFEQAGQALAAQGQARRVAARNRMGCELGQPLLAPAGSLGLPAEPARPAVDLKASRERQAPGAAAAAGQGRLAGLAPASTDGVRGRGLPRRARHACR